MRVLYRDRHRDRHTFGHIGKPQLQAADRALAYLKGDYMGPASEPPRGASHIL